MENKHLEMLDKVFEILQKTGYLQHTLGTILQCNLCKSKHVKFFDLNEYEEDNKFISEYKTKCVGCGAMGTIKEEWEKSESNADYAASNKKICLIVEGHNDVNAVVKVFPNFNFLVLSAKFSKYVINKISEATRLYDIVLIATDPDEHGNLIADKIKELFPDMSRLEIDPTEARQLTSKGWHYGLEYCTPDYIKKLMEPYL